jgi:hypothetical protein
MRSARDVLLPDRPDQIGRLDAGQHGQRELRAHAADRNEAFEQIVLQHRGKPVQRNDILAHVRVHAQGHVRSRFAETVKRRERHLDVVPDAGDVHNQAARRLLHDRPTQQGDHVVARIAEIAGIARIADMADTAAGSNGRRDADRNLRNRGNL